MFRHVLARLFGHHGRRGCVLLAFAALACATGSASACDTKSNTSTKSVVTQRSTEKSIVAAPAPRIAIAPQPRLVAVPAPTLRLVPVVPAAPLAIAAPCVCQQTTVVQTPTPALRGVFIPQDEPAPMVAAAAPCNCATDQTEAVLAPAATVHVGLLEKLRLEREVARNARFAERAQLRSGVALVAANMPLAATTTATTSFRERTRIRCN